MDQPIRKTIRGIDVHYIKSNKFKTITWSFVFTHAPGTARINEKYFLSNILVDNMKKYPTFVKKYRYLSSLYGLDAFSNVMTIGANIVNQFVVTYPNEKYIDDDPTLSEKAFEFLNEVITNPKMRLGHLTHKVYKDSMDEAKQSFKIMKSIKDMYAYYRFSKLFYDDKPDLQYNFPDNDRLQEVTLDSLTDTYKSLFDSCQVSLYVTGNFEEARFDDIIQKKMSPLIKSNPVNIIYKSFPYNIEREPRIQKEFGEVSQARLFIGFLTDIGYFSDKHPALAVFNNIFGGFDQSKLFMDIREKSHLAYYVDSNYLSEENMIIVPIVCDFGKEDLVISKVKTALTEIIAGDFSDSLFEQAKNDALNAIESINDSQPIYLLQHIKNFQLFNQKYDLQERIQRYKGITRSDVIEAAKSLVLDTIYIHTKGGNGRG